MKNLILGLINGRDQKFNGMIALAFIALIALGCTCNKDWEFNTSQNSTADNSSATTDPPFGGDDDEDGEMQNDRLLMALVKETTADFAYSISNEDFSKMYGKASQDFQSTYTEEQMEEFFKDFIKNKRQLLPILSKAVTSDPEFDGEPFIRTENGLSILVVNGKYATKPVPVTFNYEYVKRGGQWKMLVLKVFVR